uniref:Uncharacterized protein n=1 Tax=Anopheles farauti TaxID=69004 RepID=A0A182QKB9_9DIPT
MLTVNNLRGFRLMCEWDGYFRVCRTDGSFPIDTDTSEFCGQTPDDPWTNGPRRGEHSDEQFDEGTQQKRPQRSASGQYRFLRRVRQMEPVLPTRVLVEHQHQQCRARDGVDEQELAHTVDVHGKVVHKGWCGRTLPEVGGKQIAGTDDPAREQGHDHERQQRFVGLVSDETGSCKGGKNPNGELLSRGVAADQDTSDAR